LKINLYLHAYTEWSVLTAVLQSSTLTGPGSPLRRHHLSSLPPSETCLWGCSVLPTAAGGGPAY